MFKRKVCHERQIRALLDIFVLKTIIDNIVMQEITH